MHEYKETTIKIAFCLQPRLILTARSQLQSGSAAQREYKVSTVVQDLPCRARVVLECISTSKICATMLNLALS